MILVDRTLDILEAVLNSEDELSLKEISEITGLNISAVRRYATTLTKRGYLFQKNKGGKYSIGLKLMRFSNPISASINIREVALPFLKKLSDDTCETVHMAMLDGIQLVTLEIIVPKQVIRIYPEIGDTKKYFPLYCTALGKILLAYMPKKTYQGIVKNMDLKVFTENTISNLATLDSELSNVRRDNVAFDDEEYKPGIRSVAVPVRNDNGNVIAAISLVSPTIRICRVEMRNFVPLVKSCAYNISRQLGYNI
jgi:IclR family transcriptional regulator, KDG regulon repressor